MVLFADGHIFTPRVVMLDSALWPGDCSPRCRHWRAWPSVRLQSDRNRSWSVCAASVTLQRRFVLCGTTNKWCLTEAHVKSFTAPIPLKQNTPVFQDRTKGVGKEKPTSKKVDAKRFKSMTGLNHIEIKLNSITETKKLNIKCLIN